MNLGDIARIGNAAIDTGDKKAAKIAAARAMMADPMAPQLSGQGMQAGGMTGAPPQPVPPGQPSMPPGGPSGPQVPPPQMPAGQMGGGPNLGGLPGAAPAPSFMPQAQGMPPGGPQGPQVRPQPMPQAQVQPQASAAPPQAGGGDPSLSGVADPTGNGIYSDMQKTLQAMGQRIQKANPGIQPATLYDAMALQLDQMKGLNPEARIYAQSMVANKKIDAEFQAKMIHEQGLDARAAAADERIRQLTEENNRVKEQIAQLQANSREAVGAGHDRARVDSAGIGANARVQSAGISADARTRSAQIGADASDRRAQAGYDRGVDSASIGMGKKPISGRAGSAGSAGGGRAAAPQPAKGGGAPPFDPKQYAGHTAKGPDNSTWKSDGKRWVKTG